MWVLTSFGAFMPALRHAKDVKDGDNRLLQIRARRVNDLVIMKRLYLPNASEIVRNAGTDYEARVYCTHQEWAEAMRQMSMDIDYTSFKNTTDRWHDNQLHRAYMSVWSTLYTILGTRRAFDIEYDYRPSPRKRGKGKGKKSKTVHAEVLVREYENDDFGNRWANWWDDGPSVEEEMRWK